MKEEFKIIIIGSREFDNYQYFCKKCDKLLSGKKLTHNITIITGNHGNTDKFAQCYAFSKNYNIIIEKADYEQHPKDAMYFRNKKIINEYKPHGCIAFNLNNSKGTKNMINLCKIYNIEIREIKLTK